MILKNSVIVIATMVCISFQAVVASEGPGDCGIGVAIDIFEQSQKNDFIAQAKKFNDATFRKIVCTEKLIDALVPYATEQIKEAKKEFDAAQASNSSSIELIGQDTGTWQKKMVSDILEKERVVLLYLSCLPSAGVTYTNGTIDTDADVAYKYLMKDTQIWNTAYKRAEQYSEQKIIDIMSHIQQIGACTATQINTQLTTAVEDWINDVSDNTWKREDEMKLREEHSFANAQENQDDKEKYLKNRERLDTMQEAYLTAYNSAEVQKAAEAASNIKAIKDRYTVVYNRFLVYPAQFIYYIARLFGFSDTIPLPKLSAKERKVVDASEWRNEYAVKKLFPTELINLLDNHENKNVRRAANNFYIAVDQYKETKLRWCGSLCPQNCAVCMPIREEQQRFINNKDAFDNYLLLSEFAIHRVL